MIFILYLPILVLAMVGVVLTPQIATLVHNNFPTLDVFKVFTVDAAKQVAEAPEAVIPLFPWVLDLAWAKENLCYLPWLGLGMCLAVAGLAYCRRSNTLPQGRPSQSLHEECIEVLSNSDAPTAESILRLINSPLDVDFEDLDGEDAGYETSYEWQYDEDGEYAEECYYAGEDSHSEDNGSDHQDYDEGTYDECSYYKSDEDDEDEEDEFQVAAALQTHGSSMPTSLSRPLEMVLWRRSLPPAAATHDGQPKKRKTRRGGKKIAEFKRLKAVARAEAAAAGNNLHSHCTKTIEPESPVTPTPRSSMTPGSGNYSLDGPHTPVERSCPNWPPRAPSPSQLPKLFASVSSSSDLQEVDSNTSHTSHVEAVTQEPIPTYSPSTPPGDTLKVEETPVIEEHPPRGRPVITEGGFRMIRHFLRIAQRSRAKDVPLTKRASPAKDDSPNRTLVDKTEPASAKATPEKISGAKGITPTKPEAKTTQAARRRAGIAGKGLGLEEYDIVYNPCS